MTDTRKVTLLFSDNQTKTVPVPEGETVVRAAARHGLKLLVDCREGGCGTCKARCRLGDYTLDDFSDEALTATEAAARTVLTCRMQPQSDCLVEFDYPMSAARRGKRPKPRSVTLEAVTPLAADVVELRVSADDGNSFDFMPGQYANLMVPSDGFTRSYSFVSLPGTPEATFVVRLVPGGMMSSWLSQRGAIGSTLLLDGPFGRFFLRDTGRPIVMVAGGTGIGPMLSMLDSLAADGAVDRPVRVAFGVTASANVFYQERLAASLARFSDASAMLAAMTVDAGWDGVAGTAIDALERIRRPRDFDAYLCGPPAMTDAGRAWLKDAGVPEDAIFAEAFVPTEMSKCA